MRVDQRDTIVDVWVEAQIDADGIGLTLVSESPDVGAVVEAVDHYTFEELQDMEGEMFNLNLSGNAREILADTSEDARIARMLQSESLEEKGEHLPENPSSDELLTYMGLLGGEVAGEPTGEDPDGSIDVATGQTEKTYNLPQVADVLRDGNPPDWSEDNRVRVIEVTDTPADEYVIQESEFGRERTVADANPSEPADAPVVVANYVGSNKQYAFPVTRLEEL